MTEPQTFYDKNLPAEMYHAHSYLGSTTIARARKSWKHALTEVEQTPAMIFGSAFHALIGEPKLFKEKYVVAPKIDRRTKAGRTQHQEFLQQNIGKVILNAEDHDCFYGMLESILSNKTALQLLTNGLAETSYFWIDKDHNTGLKCRPDYYRHTASDYPMIVDIKTAEDASENAFQRTLVPYGRHIQSAVYLDGMTEVTGIQHNAFIYIVVEKKAPHGIGIYSLDDDSISQGRHEYKQLIKQHAEHKKNGHFPSYPEEIRSISLPVWALKYEW